jgi:hypothetical protein
VQLWFNERLEPAFSKLRVVDRDGRQVDTGDVRDLGLRVHTLTVEQSVYAGRIKPSNDT